MKKILCSVGFVFTCFVSSTNAATFNLSNERTYGDWFSAKMSLGNEIYFRAGNSSYSNAILMVDYYPNSCDSPFVQIMVPDLDPIPTDVSLSFKGYVRVDQQKVIDGLAHLNGSRGETYAFWTIRSKNPSDIIQALKSGNKARFKLKDDDPIFYTFGLKEIRRASCRERV